MRVRTTRVLATTLVGLGLAGAVAFAQDVVLTGTDGNDTLTGTAAPESIYGRAGNDLINAGAGDDELDGGPGADALNGGEGSDSVAYAGSAPVEVSLDGAANDGAGEGDNVGADVEDIFGADGPDKLNGSAGVNTIDGGGGDDRIVGGGGEDTLFGGGGDDIIDARDDQADRVECGDGNDVATLDRNDIVAGDCEQKSKPALSIRPRMTFVFVPKRQMLISSIVDRSALLITCATRCSGSQTVVKRSSVKLTKGVVRLPLPAKIAGKTIELGAAAPGALPNCVRIRVGRKHKSLDYLRGKCTTAARSLSR